MNLAINGGPKIREKKFPYSQTIGEEEAKAAYDTVKSGILSKYLGCWDPDFFGGPKVQEFEKRWAEKFQVKHAIAVNSNSTGLYCSMGAAGIGPGDEVIVTPYSMSISASIPLFFGAIPIFADIEEDTFCLDVNSVEEKITERTRAILVVDIFGQPYDADRINQLAKKHNLTVIEDTAQAPLAFYKDKMAGTLGDLGIFSLNYHKHIHTGEGGMIVTDDDDLATRCRLIRNHAEAVIDDMEFSGPPINMLGLNFRLPEIESSIGLSLLNKLDDLIKRRRDNVDYLEDKLSSINFLTMPKVREGCSHSYYMHSILFDKSAAGVERNKYVNAVAAELPVTERRESEGVLMSSGYVKPLYLQGLYQKRYGFGKAGYPWDTYGQNVDYSKGLCPVTEKLHYESLFTHEFMRPDMTKSDLDDVANAFYKVTENINELK